MKLHYYRPNRFTSNFGDELNKYIWNHFFPNFFDKDETNVFFGIGTILRAGKKKYPNSNVIIFGSGAHSNDQKMESNFKVNFVRGPLTGKALNLNNDKYITDPAILTPIVFPVKTSFKKYSFSYMPHYSVANKSYQNAVEGIGIKYIDPTNTVKSIIDDIVASEVLICEAMHGAIVADAYRIPWIPVATFDSFNNFKWNDWGESLSISFKVNRLHRLYSKSNFIGFFKSKYFTYKLKKLTKSKTYLSEKQKSTIAKNKILNKITEFKNETNNFNNYD